MQLNYVFKVLLGALFLINTSAATLTNGTVKNAASDGKGTAVSAAQSTTSAASSTSSSASVSGSGGGYTYKEIVPGSVYKGVIKINEPVAAGVDIYGENGITIDASNADKGYIMVKCEGSDSRIKICVAKGDDVYYYDLRTDGAYEVLPLQLGDGVYEISAFQNVSGTKYSLLYTTQLDVKLTDPDSVFVYPNQYVWYVNDDDAVKLSYDICDGLTTDSDKLEALYTYVTNYLEYDYDLAANVEKGYIPDLAEVLKAKKGICFDYSALLGSMLRAQNIPVKLIIGYVEPDGLYHAWNLVEIDGEWRLIDSTFGAQQQPDDSYTQERFY